MEIHYFPFLSIRIVKLHLSYCNSSLDCGVHFWFYQPDATPTCLYLCSYLLKQRGYLFLFVALPVDEGMVHFNISASLASVPLQVPTAGPVLLRFTVHHRHIKRFTVKHQVPKPNIRHELSELLKSRYFAIFELLNGCWELP